MEKSFGIYKTIMEEIKNKGGRPSKLNENWLKIADEVLSEDINAIIYTDEELVDEINERLPDEAKTSQRTFATWKAKNKESKKDIDEMGERFLHLIKKALRKQKGYLFVKFRNDEKAWTKWAWILERKFEDWNIRQKTDITTGGEKINNEFYEISDPKIKGIIKHFGSELKKALSTKNGE